MTHVQTKPSNSHSWRRRPPAHRLQLTCECSCRKNLPKNHVVNLHFSPHDGPKHAIRPPGLRCACLPCSTYCSSTPARAKRLAPRPDAPLTHFASPRGEKCRLIVSTSTLSHVPVSGRPYVREHRTTAGASASVTRVLRRFRLLVLDRRPDRLHRRGGAGPEAGTHRISSGAWPA